MEPETKLFLGKLLGEVYCLQRLVQPKNCAASEATTYGLLNGIESVIDECIPDEFITSADINTVADTLEPYFNQSKQLKGYYDIEHNLETQGVDRVKAIKVLTYFKAKGQFSFVIKIIEDGATNGGSPIELGHLDDV